MRILYIYLTYCFVEFAIVICTAEEASAMDKLASGGLALIFLAGLDEVIFPKK